MIMARHYDDLRAEENLRFAAVMFGWGDAEGREVSRAAGAPTKQAVIASLGRFA